MARSLRVIGLSGSLRQGSLNTALLRAAGELMPVGMALDILDLRGVPFYDGDLEAKGVPPSVTELKAKIQAADALLLASPEYNHSIAPVLKNALDWATRPHGQSVLDGKPVALLGAGGGSGTVRAQLHLRDVAIFTNMHVLNKPEVFVTNAASKFVDGRLVDEPTRTIVTQLMTALAGWAERHRTLAALPQLTAAE